MSCPWAALFALPDELVSLVVSRLHNTDLAAVRYTCSKGRVFVNAYGTPHLQLPASALDFLNTEAILTLSHRFPNLGSLWLRDDSHQQQSNLDLSCSRSYSSSISSSINSRINNPYLNISGWSNNLVVTDDKAVAFAARNSQQLAKLHTLSLKHCLYLGPRGTAALLAACTSLTHLALSRWTGTASLQGGLPSLQQLIHIDLGAADTDVLSVDDASLRSLAACAPPSLQSVSLQRCVAVTDDGVAALAGVPTLRALCLAGTRITGRALAATAAQAAAATAVAGMAAASWAAGGQQQQQQQQPERAWADTGAGASSCSVGGSGGSGSISGGADAGDIYKTALEAHQPLGSRLQVLDVTGCSSFGDAELRAMLRMAQASSMSTGSPGSSAGASPSASPMRQATRSSVAGGSSSSTSHGLLLPQLQREEGDQQQEQGQGAALPFLRLSHTDLPPLQKQQQQQRRQAQQPVPALQELRASGTAVTNAGFAHLSQARHLRLLDLGPSFQLDAPGLKHLASLPLLQQLCIGSFNLTGPWNGQQPALQHPLPWSAAAPVAAAAPAAAAAGASAAAALGADGEELFLSLHTLKFGGTFLNRGLRHAFPLGCRLTRLAARGCDAVTDGNMAVLARCQPSLTRLELSGGYQLTAEGLQVLARMPCLASLSLTSCPLINRQHALALLCAAAGSAAGAAGGSSSTGFGGSSGSSLRNVELRRSASAGDVPEVISREQAAAELSLASLAAQRVPMAGEDTALGEVDGVGHGLLLGPCVACA